MHLTRGNHEAKNMNKLYGYEYLIKNIDKKNNFFNFF